MNNRPYIYSEDSRLLGRVISSLEDSVSFLEIGVGNGKNLVSVKDKFRVVVGTDLNLEVRGDFRSAVELVVADKASCFRSSSFDLVAFNPPYVPSEGIEDRTIDGGRNGIEIPLEFLSSALEVLKPAGRVVMVVSSEDSIDELEDFCEKRGLKSKKIAEVSLFFESLYVYLINR